MALLQLNEFLQFIISSFISSNMGAASFLPDLIKKEPVIVSSWLVDISIRVISWVLRPWWLISWGVYWTLPWALPLITLLHFYVCVNFNFCSHCFPSTAHKLVHSMRGNLTLQVWDVRLLHWQPMTCSRTNNPSRGIFTAVDSSSLWGSLSTWQGWKI